MTGNLHDRRGRTQAPSPAPSTALAEAAAWLARRDAGALLPEEDRAFKAWLAASEENRKAYAKTERIWRLAEEAGREERAARRARPPVRPMQRTPRLGAAVAAGLAACLALFITLGTDLPLRLKADAMTAAGELETLTLPDGSIVTLGTASALAVDYGKEERRIRLLAGEASFKVTKDAARPFRVEAAGGAATALGTEFLMRERENGATITVLEGRVSVEAQSAPGPGAAVLTAAQKVSFGAQGLGPVEKVDLAAAAAWRRGKLAFVDVPLGEVIAELDRYHPGVLRVLDAELRGKKVSGIFEARDPLKAVEALENSLGLSSTRLSDYLILVHR